MDYDIGWQVFYIAFSILSDFTMLIDISVLFMIVAFRL